MTFNLPADVIFKKYIQSINVNSLQPRCVSIEGYTMRGLEFTLATCAFRSLFSTSRFRFSPKAVVRDASLEFSKASRSLSLCEAPAKSDSFLVFLAIETGAQMLNHVFLDAYDVQRWNVMMYILSSTPLECNSVESGVLERERNRRILPPLIK